MDINSLEMRHITKRFPGVTACDDISLEIRSGEVLALLGENGAGKTTLMNILYGLYRQDSGSIWIDGREVQTKNPSEAFDLGIGMVHQHFMLVPNLTVLENIALGFCRHMGIRLDLKTVREKIEEISQKHDLPVNPDSLVWKLSVGEQQRVELIKVLCLGAKVLILDEPTAALTPQETDELILILKKMASQGCSIVFISHKLHEVKEVSDRVAVLRSGKLVWQGDVSDLSVSDLAEKMAGRAIFMPITDEKEQFGHVMLQLDRVHSYNDRGTKALDCLSLEVRSGEIMGVAGVSGNGQRELAEVINGMRRVESGTITFKGQDITNRTPQKIIDMGMGYIPEDRIHEGTIPSFSVKENLILKDYFRSPLAVGPFLSQNTIKEASQKLIDQFKIKTPDMETSCASLSGGNIQKVILAREISRSPSVLVASYPIRGLDMGAAEYVHNRIIEARNSGTAVLLISEELDEIMDLSDRIAVIYEGRILKIMSAKGVTKRELGLLMAGVGGEANVCEER